MGVELLLMSGRHCNIINDAANNIYPCLCKSKKGNGSNMKFHPFYNNSWALVIGINAYQYGSPLSYACNDSDAVASMLIIELGFPKDNLFILKDEAATKQAILDTYLGFHDKANNPDDRLFVFFAGHGLTLEGLHGPIGYLVPVDGRPEKINSLIRWDDLTRNSEIITAKHILFIMDACYSGLALQRAVSPGSQRFVSDLLQRLSRQVMTAGKADETVANGGGPEGKNSIFTGHLLEGLKGAASDTNGIITANTLMAYVYQKVGQDNRSKQTPHFGYFEGDGDFIFRTPDLEHLGAEKQKEFLVTTHNQVPEDSTISAELLPKPGFVERNNYGDPTSPNFGRNNWTRRLGELRRNEEGDEFLKIYSWLSLVIEPIANQSISLDLTNLAERLKNYKPESDSPYDRFRLPRKVMTTIDSVILYEEIFKAPDLWGLYIRIDKQGNIELADSLNVFIEFKTIRNFLYVPIVGLTWQFIFFARNILLDAGYSSGAKMLVNLVGTRDTILSDFSKGNGENNNKWLSPYVRDIFVDPESLFQLTCPDSNILLEYQVIVGSLGEKDSFTIIKDLAEKLGLAYNHQSQPRCFNYNTEVFPWNQYFSSRRL